MVREDMRLAVEPIANLIKTTPEENQTQPYSSRKKKGIEEFS